MNHSFRVASLFGLSLCVSHLSLAQDPVSATPDGGAQAQEPPGNKSPGNGHHGQVLKRFDKNGDGQLGPREMAAAKEAKARLDRNQNGQVSKRELEAAKKAFNRADLNNNGQLGPHEKAAAKQKREQASSTRQRNVADNKSPQGSPGTSSSKKSAASPNGRPANFGGQNSKPNGQSARGGGKPPSNGNAQKSGPGDQPLTFSGMRAAAQRGGPGGGHGGGSRPGGLGAAPGGGRPAGGGGGGGGHRR